MTARERLLRTPEEIAYFAGKLRAWAGWLHPYLSDPVRFGAELGERLSSEARLFLNVARDSDPELERALRRANALLGRTLRIARAAAQPSDPPLSVLVELAKELELAAMFEELLSREQQELELVPLPFRRELSPNLLASVAETRRATAERERRLVKARPLLSEINRWIEQQSAGVAGGRPRGSTAAAENETRNWLRTQGSRQRSTKDQVFSEAKQLFGVSKRAFDRAWAAAVPPEWTHGGRPRNPDTKTPAPKSPRRES